jgi:hypothetical protein
MTADTQDCDEWIRTNVPRRQSLRGRVIGISVLECFNGSVDSALVSAPLSQGLMSYVTVPKNRALGRDKFCSVT